MVALVAVRQLLVTGFVVVGVFFLTVGTIGLIRLPNVYNRMHATSKPTTLGTASIFLAGFVEFGPGGAGLTSLVGIIFLFLTVPTGAHMISRAAQKTGISFLAGVTWPEDTRENADTDNDGNGDVNGDDNADNNSDDNGDGNGNKNGEGDQNRGSNEDG
jgi:multicomponent Na+:H+ antiporter subunit G